MKIDRLPENETKLAEFKPLPVGGYKTKIVKTELATSQNGNQCIIIGFDITDGEYKGYFKQQFDGSKLENKKYKGLIRLWLPNKESQYYDKQLKSYWRNIYAIENANNGFKFDDTENHKTLVGKTAYIMVAEKDWEFNGKRGVSAKPINFVYKKNVEDGSVMERVEYMASLCQNRGYSNQKQGSTPTQDGFYPIDDSETDEDLPF